MPVDEKTKTDITDMLYRFADAHTLRNSKALLALLAPDYSGYGSGPGEKSASPEDYFTQAKRYFEKCDSLSIIYKQILVRAYGNVAWSAADCMVNIVIDGIPYELNGRLTAVLKQFDETWLFEQTHFSFPLPKSKEGLPHPYRVLK